MKGRAQVGTLPFVLFDNILTGIENKDIWKNQVFGSSIFLSDKNISCSCINCRSHDVGVKSTF